MIEGFSELFGSILGRMVAEDASKDNKLELLSLLWGKYVLGTHIHEANVTEISIDFAL